MTFTTIETIHVRRDEFGVWHAKASFAPITGAFAVADVFTFALQRLDAVAALVESILALKIPLAQSVGISTER